jgi:hypothetical protein
MQSNLVTYLHDHLAGSHFAVELLKSLQNQFPNELGLFVQETLTEVRQDQATLLSIVDRIGEGKFDFYQFAGWLSEKVSRLKLHEDGSAMGIGTLEALEALALGIQGKLALWRSLNAIESTDARLSGYGFPVLIEKAEAQFRRVEEERIAVVRRVLSAPASPAVKEEVVAATPTGPGN